MATEIPVLPSAVPAIPVLDRIEHVPDVWTYADDWTGVTSTAERKKRQNRINQRAYRRRKGVVGHGQIISMLPLTQPSDAPPATEVALDGQGDGRPPPEGRMMLMAEEGGPLLLQHPHKTAKARRLMRQALEDHSLGAVRPSNLHILIRLNVLNAMARNAVAMGFSPEGLCRDDLISPYSQQSPGAFHDHDHHYDDGDGDHHHHHYYGRSLPAPVPDSLRATAAQRRIPHHPWIDLFPFPRFRDNMLHALAVGAIDEDELCLDMLEIDDPGDPLANKPVFLVWGASWDDRGWEASVPFLRKWGWLLRGCPEIIEGTNRWRRQRGEKQLVFDVSEGSDLGWPRSSQR